MPLIFVVTLIIVLATVMLPKEKSSAGCGNLQTIRQCAKDEILRFYGNDDLYRETNFVATHADIIAKGSISNCYHNDVSGEIGCFLIAVIGDDYHLYQVLFDYERGRIFRPRLDRDNFISREMFEKFRNGAVDIGDEAWQRLPAS